MHFNKPSANTARCKSIFAIYISQMMKYVYLLCFCMLYGVYILMMQITKENYCLTSVYTLHVLVL